MTEKRTEQLKRKVLDASNTVCTERARFYTEVYRANRDKPVILRRALALEQTLKHMSLRIEPGELIVGNHSTTVRAAPIFPEYAVDWLLDELDQLEKRPGDVFYVSRSQKQSIREICEYWRGETVCDRAYALMPAETLEIHEAQITRAVANLTSGDGHIAVNFSKILELGLGGYLQRVQEMRSVLDLTTQDDIKKNLFYRSLEIGIGALQAFIDRFAHLAEEQIRESGDARRQKELEQIRDTCRCISCYPPRSFREALQLVYFLQLVLQIESNGHSVSLGRLDQYLYPFFQNDIQQNLITNDEVAELLECLWIKLYSINKIRPWSHTRYAAGSPLYQNVTIGGQKSEGVDAVNELSELILETVGRIRLPQPNLVVRYHRNIAQNFMMACLRVIEQGSGMPAFVNDEIVIPSFLEIGVEEADAYDYSAIGCIEVAVPGKWGYRCTGMCYINLMRVFLATLHDGRDVTTGKTFNPGSGHFKDFTNFDQLMKAWRTQIHYYTRQSVITDTCVDTALEELVPDVLCSAFVDECIERGKTIKEGGAKYDFISGLQVGIANLGNSLASIKKLVFDENRINKQQLLAALNQDFQGIEGERIRQVLLNSAAKYGNDDDSVDKLLQEAYSYYIEELAQYRNTRFGRGPIGGGYYAGTSSIAGNVPAGTTVAATPDGRKAFTPLAEGCSPCAGTDVLGPTAVLKSVSKLPTSKILGGVLLNQKISPSTIGTESDKMKIIWLLRTFFNELKGWHIQYNVVDRQTLLEAQREPEKYRDLIVRVAGYSAFFTSLAPETQNDIISRTEQVI